MRIELKGNYVITSDVHQFTLNKKSISKGEKTLGEEVLTPIAYQTNLEQILKSYTNKNLLESKSTSIKELLDELRELKLYIKEIMEA